MKIILIELNLQYSIVTHQSALTSILDLSLSFKVATMWQTDGTAYKLKPRSFHKFVHLWVHFVDFYPSVNYTWHYVNKALFIVMYIKMLGNSIHRLFLYQKCLCYRPCILPIILYSFSLWYYNKMPLSYLLNILNKIQ